MTSAPHHTDHVTDPAAEGWRWVPERRVHLWWDGEQFTYCAAWKGSTPVVTPYRPPPSRGRVALLLGSAAVLLGLTVAFGSWGYDQLERNCRDEFPADVDLCVADRSFGVDMIDAIGVMVSIGLLVIGLSGVHRRRRARRETAAASGPPPSPT